MISHGIVDVDVDVDVIVHVPVHAGAWMFSESER